jgi:membrane protease YdiL (CAAX protease family)
MIRLTRSDWLFIAVCIAIAAVSVFVVLHWFTSVFPEASIDFRYDRDSSQKIAEPLVAAQVRGMKHTAVFDGDDQAKIFLERTLGLARATPVMRRDVRLWWWHHRWFRPLQEEELAVDVAPTGEIVGYEDTIPEALALPSPDVAGARRIAEGFLAKARVNVAGLQLVAQSERRLPGRMQRIFTWESQSVHPAGTQYRHVVTVDGDRVGSYRQRLRVPDAWARSYEELRSKNGLAGTIDFVFLAITMICIVAVFIVRLLRGDVKLRFVFAIFAVTVVLVAGAALNSFPIALAGYSTTSSYSAFLARFVLLGALLPGVGYGMLLVVVAGAGEVMYRERLPQHLALPRLWTPRALASRRVFRSFILGYTLVALFLGYQVAFYLIAGKFGAWSPAEVPYDSMLNTAFPWVAVLFAGFFPALSEEFMSRAFSIPFFERVFRSRVFAVVLAAFIWGFGHSTYPNQPFFIRGLEVGIAGCILGWIFYRFGLLPLLIWHYTVDALYTALLLLRSGNHYYVVSGALSSLVFAIPMLISIALYIRNRGFVPDDELSNATLPVAAPPERAAPVETEVPLPEPVRITPVRALLCLGAIALAAVLIWFRPPSIDDVIDYRITAAQAKLRGGQALLPVPPAQGQARVPVLHIIAQPQEGFRAWEPRSPREDGGSPSGFDPTAAEYLVRHGLSMQKLVDVMRTRIEAATWMVRAYTPQQKEEHFVEVDPRTGRVIGYHKYQSETNPGARLDQAPAQAIARAAFARYGVDANAFDVKEALAFQQPNRRDWLFHFEERQPLAADGHRRISVRVAGAEVTQFTTTIKIPDSVYRDEAKETLLNVVLGLVRLGAALLTLALIIAGFVMAARRGHFPWRRALRWTLVLAVIPIANAAVHWPLSLFDYQTSESWQTFITGNLVRTIFVTGLKLGGIFLALAGIDVAYPHALELRRRAARARVGRAALAAALTALSVMAIFRALAAMIEQRFPDTISIDALRVPQSVAIALPSLWAIGNAVIMAIMAAAAAGLLVYALRSFSEVRWLPDAAGIALLFCLTIDSGVTAKQLPAAIAATLVSALLVWALVRFVLGANLLAYPLAVVIGQLLLGAATLMQNHREDLIVNGIVMLAAAAAAALWAALPREVPSARVESNPLAAVEAQALPGVEGNGRDRHLHSG